MNENTDPGLLCSAALGERSLKHVGYISTEGGPLLLIDGSLAPSWRGVTSGGADFASASKLFDHTPKLEGGEISIGSGQGVLWEMEGAGTADLFEDGQGGYIIVRAWPNDPVDTNASRVIAHAATHLPKEIGTLYIPSGVMVVLWSVEAGPLLSSQVPPSSRPTGLMSSEEAGLVLAVQKTRFFCLHDKVQTHLGVGRRLHLKGLNEDS